MKNINKIFNLIGYEILVIWVTLSGVMSFDKKIISIIIVSILTLLLIFIDRYYIKNNGEDNTYKKIVMLLSFLLVVCYCIITILPMLIGHSDCIICLLNCHCKIIYGIGAFKVSNYLLIMFLFASIPYVICIFIALFIIKFIVKRVINTSK